MITTSTTDQKLVLCVCVYVRVCGGRGRRIYLNSRIQLMVFIFEMAWDFFPAQEDMSIDNS